VDEILQAEGASTPTIGDTSGAIVLRTLDQVVERAQALSRTLLAGQTGASVDEFLADRARDSKDE
jgi:hypothetical protein